MKPLHVSVHVPYPREQVYEFLAVSANHEPFNQHLMTDWSFSGPPRGVGSKTHATAALAGKRDPVEIEVIDDVAPHLITERNVGAGGARVATGTYSLTETPDGTTVTFDFAWVRVPRSERLAAPLVRRVMRRALQTSMRELATTLDTALAGAGHAHG